MKKIIIFLFILVVIIQSATWTNVLFSGHNIPPSRSGDSAVLIDDLIYRFGGHHEVTAFTIQPFNDLYSFNTRTNFYTLIPPKCPSNVPSPRTWHAHTKIPGPKFLIFGGGLFSGFTVNFVDNQTWIYNAHHNEWTNMNPTGHGPSPRFTAAAILKDNNVYIFGGVDTNLTFFNDMYKYNIEENCFSVVEQFGELPPGVSDTRLVIKDNYLYLQGGEILDETGIGNLEGLYRFNFESHFWKKLSPSPDIAPHPERDAQVFAGKGNKIYTFGGDTDGPNFFNLKNDTWRYNIEENSWILINTTIAPPASKRNSFAFKDDELFVFINVIGPPNFGAAIESQQVWKFIP